MSCSPLLRLASVTGVLATVALAGVPAAAGELPPCEPAELPSEPAATEVWAPPSEPKETLTATGYVGLGLAAAGVGMTVMGTATVLALDDWPDQPHAEEMAWAGGVAGVGLLFMGVGIPLILVGTEEKPTTIAIAPGGIHVSGSF